MIEARNLSKRYGTTLAVDDLSFSVEAGQVTRFLFGVLLIIPGLV